MPHVPPQSAPPPDQAAPEARPVYHSSVLRALLLTRLRELHGALTPAAMVNVMLAVLIEAGLIRSEHPAATVHSQHSALALVVATEALRANAPANQSFKALAQSVLDALDAYGIGYYPMAAINLLTPMQTKVLALYAEGLTYKEIAKETGCKSNTVRTHLQQARLTLGALNTTHAAVIADRLGLFNLSVRVPLPRPRTA